MPRRQRLLALEAHRIAADDDVGVTVVARELRIDTEEAAMLLSWLPCEECKVPSRTMSRVKGKGQLRCNSCYRRALRVSRGQPAYSERRGSGRGEFPVAVLREEMLRRDLEPKEVAARLGWTTPWKGKRNSGRQPDGPRVRRYLGMRPNSDGTIRQRCDYDTAVRFCRAIGCDPVDVGL